MSVNGTAAPVLSEVDALRLEKTVALFELAHTKSLMLQAEARRYQTEADALLAAAAREGYTLRRLENGSFVYVAVEGAAAPSEGARRDV
jgi:hypothetical protein